MKAAFVVLLLGTTAVPLVTLTAMARAVWLQDCAARAAAAEIVREDAGLRRIMDSLSD